MPATFTSVADPTLTAQVTFAGRPQRTRVEDRRLKQWDNAELPEVHRGVKRYVQWSFDLTFPAPYRGEAETLDAFFKALYTMANAKFTLEVSAPAGSSEPPWTGTVELLTPEVAQDLASTPTATRLPFDLVEVAA